MGILSRFKEIMKVNVGALLDRAEEPDKIVDEYMRRMNSDLGQVKAETASVLAAEGRVKRELDECAAEVRKLQRYAEKSVESGDEEGALKFLERKAKQAERLNELQAAHEEAAANAARMKEMQDKLISDLNRLEERRFELKGKLAEADALRQRNAGAASGGTEAAFRAAEEKANMALYQAEALAELRGGAKEDDLDALIAELENGARKDADGAEEELAAIKAKLKGKE
ncbi:PspA/IM30 family protein [Paenibacillus sp. M1]|uniref:PspA/IM30 family protein n=1 Tax=Paenibacillus haidiansis TaxID=1574488 RepID=A0ABU7VXY1_9BACL